ncbi:type IV fimbrial biogenesis protein PilX [Desulfocucumis palustris]|uniref:Type IV fimbrial biogenesis protein PilX n=1 Tax=Desulfocucumis palustris TaxID=1898651 RepID=A0A2L2X994_9FIRM|nr:PilX N-terminal domain-containing pilus assembly protein [Desulfocucumis palustris]GBF32765.1 type IV fimbrial biogenesis protein PilX [Desulfocucumis palustris]
MNFNINNQRGIALVSVLIFITVASLLGTTVWYASTRDTSHAKSDENNTQAYFFARSGVEMAISLIKSGHCNDMEPEDKVEFYGQLDGSFSEELTDDYNIKFGIELDDADRFIIDSIGIVRNGVAGAAEAQNELKYAIPRNEIDDSDGGGGDAGGGEGDKLWALFSNELITLNGSAGIIGNVATNATASNSVNFAYSCYINNGNLYIGPGADWHQVVKFDGWERGPDTNIPDGEIINLPSYRNYPLPAFPGYPDNLTSKGTLRTEPGSISGRVQDSTGKGVGEVTIYLSPSIPGDKAKTSVETVNNPSWTAGHGTWAVYTGDQQGTVIVTPAKEGYTFNPPFRKVTGPASDVNFEATENPGGSSSQVQMDTGLPWSWEIDEDGYYDTIAVTGDRMLSINLQGGTRILRVKKLDIQQGKIVLVGDGKLILYVEETFNLNGSSKLNLDGDHNSLIMFFNGGGTLNFAGATRFVGSIYAKNASVSIAGSNNIDGSIVTGGSAVSVTGAADANPMLLYSPNASLTVSGSGKIKGTAVVKKCTMDGASRITAGTSADTAFLNSLLWGPDGPPSLFLNEPEPPREPSDTTWRDRGKWIKI